MYNEYYYYYITNSSRVRRMMNLWIWPQAICSICRLMQHTTRRRIHRHSCSVITGRKRHNSGMPMCQAFSAEPNIIGLIGMSCHGSTKIECTKRRYISFRRLQHFSFFWHSSASAAIAERPGMRKTYTEMRKDKLSINLCCC